MRLAMKHNMLMIKKINPDGSEFFIEYTEGPYLQRQITETNEEGYQARHTFNAIGQTIKTEKKTGGEWIVLGLCFYDDRGNLIKDIDGKGNTIQYSYNSLDYLVSKEYMGQSESLLSKEVYTYESGEEDGERYILTHIDALGGVVVSYYDMQENLIRTETEIESGEKITKVYKYNYLGDKVLETDPNGYTTTYAYNELGRLVKVTNPMGYYVLYTYNPLGNLNYTVENNDKITTQIYDGKGRVRESRTSKQGDLTYRFKSYTYNANDQIIAEERGEFKNNQKRTLSKSSFAYDSMNRVVVVEDQISDSQKARKEYVYDKLGQVVEEKEYVDGDKFLNYVYSYDDEGRLIKEIGQYEGKYIKEYAYDNNGNLVEQTIAGKKTVYSYDYRNQIISEKQFLSDNETKEVTYTRDKKGQIIAETINAGGENRKTAYEYDLMGRMSSKIDALNQVTRYAYDHVGNLIKEVDSRYRALTFEAAPGMVYAYDALNRPIYTYLFDGNKNQVLNYKEYDAYNQVILDVKAKGYNEKQPTASIGTTFEYNIFGECISTTDPQTNYMNKMNGTKLATYEYIYDGMGNKIQEKQNGIVLWSYTYDQLGRILSETNALQNKTVYSYDLTGEHYIKVTNPLGDNQQTWNNIHGKAFKTVYADGGTETVTYNDYGQKLLKYDVLQRPTYYRYNVLGQIIQERVWVRTEDIYDIYKESVYDYNMFGEKIAAQVYEVTLNDNGELHTKKKIGDGITYKYNLAGQLIQETYVSGLVKTFAYDNAGHLIKSVAQKVGEEAQINRFAYDIRGNVIEKTQLVKIADIDNLFLSGAQYDNEYMDRIQSKQTYVYDADNNLLQSIDANGHKTVNVYDYNGRMTRQTDALNRITTIEYDMDSRVIKKETPNGMVINIEYDAAGQKRRMLEDSTTQDRAVTAYVYDKAGRLIKEIEPKDYLMGTTDENRLGFSYTYDVMGRQVGKYNKSKELIESRIYNVAGQLVAVEKGSKTIYAYDGLNNVIMQTDALGHQTRFSYDVLGKLTQSIDPLGRQTTYTYGDQHTLDRVVYPDGSSVHMEYDLLGRVIATTNQAKYKTLIAYNAFGEKRSETDALGQKTKYMYDQGGRCTQIIAANDAITHFKYDEANQIVEKKVPIYRDELGNDHYRLEKNEYDLMGQIIFESLQDVDSGEERVQTMSYYKNGLLETQTDAEGGKTSFIYDLNKNVIEIRRLRNASDIDQRYLTYDEENRLIEEAFIMDRESTQSENESLAKTIKYTYDIYGKMLTQTEASHAAISYVYDELERVAMMTSSYKEGVTTVSYTYDAIGNVMEQRQVPGVVTAYGYDSMNRMVRQQQEGVVLYTYDVMGNVKAMTDALGNTTTYTYDALNRQTSITNAMGIKSLDITFDVMGNPIITKDAQGNLTVKTFDLEGRIVSTKTPLGHISRFVYNAFGDVVEKVAPDQTSTSYEYDRAGRLVKVIDANNNTLHYGYDKANNMIYSVDAMGNISRYTYGAFGRKRSWTDALGKITTYRYDLVGNLILVTDRNGQKLEYTYNDRGMLTKRKVQGTDVEVGYVYDALGNLLEMTDGTGITVYSYDNYSRLVDVFEPEGRHLSYGYDVNGNRTHMVGVNGKTTRYTYDALSRLSQVIYDGAMTRYDYDVLGNRTSVLLPNGVMTLYTFNQDSRITQVDHINSHGGKISSYMYTYDANGRETSKTDEYGKTMYRYDQLGRLKEVSAPGYVNVYGYDANGNRTQQVSTYLNLQASGYQSGEEEEVFYRKEVTYYTYDRSNRMIKTLVKMYNDINAELMQKTTGYLYDDNGNETAQFTTFVKPHTLGLNQQMNSNVEGKQDTDILIQRRVSHYDGFNRLVRMEDTRGGERQKMTYIYNGADQRVKKIVLSNKRAEMITTRFTYDGDYLIHEASTSGQEISYVRGLTYLLKNETIESEVRSYYLQDEHGNVTYMVNESGEVVNAYDYDAFGKAIFTLETGASNAIRYTSEYQDVESGLYYLRARYYNPEIGRFTSEDSYRASRENPFRLNLYTYCHNDPINFVDPSGHWEIGDEKLSKSAQKKIKRLTDEYFGTSNQDKRSRIQKEANAIREREKDKKNSSRDNGDSFSKKINEKIKKSTKKDSKNNKYINAETWKQVSRETSRRTRGEAQYAQKAAVNVISYIEKEVGLVGDYQADIEKYTVRFRGTRQTQIEKVNMLLESYITTSPYYEKQVALSGNKEMYSFEKYMESATSNELAIEVGIVEGTSVFEGINRDVYIDELDEILNYEAGQSLWGMSDGFSYDFDLTDIEKLASNDFIRDRLVDYVTYAGGKIGNIVAKEGLASIGLVYALPSAATPISIGVSVYSGVQLANDIGNLALFSDMDVDGAVIYNWEYNKFEAFPGKATTTTNVNMSALAFYKSTDEGRVVTAFVVRDAVYQEVYTGFQVKDKNGYEYMTRSIYKEINQYIVGQLKN